MSVPRNKDYSDVLARMSSVVAQFQEDARTDAAVLQVARDSAPKFVDAEEAEVLYRKGLKDPSVWAAVGVTKESLLVAIHALKPRSEAPIYLQHAQERHIARMKVLPTENGGGGRSLAVVLPTRGTVIDAEAKEAEDDE